MLKKKFNITGTCFPDRHYMVDIRGRVAEIKKMVDENAYFCINRGRQYGKTTTLGVLKNVLAPNYEIYAISFEGLSDNAYDSEERLAFSILQLFYMDGMKRHRFVSDAVQELVDRTFKKYEASCKIDLGLFSVFLTQMCDVAKHPMVLMIDEVDQASNFISFIHFLGLLRHKYLERDVATTFQSVILAGVYDIKNLKLKIRPDGEHQYNSPWNIAEDFNIDMSFHLEDVEGMLKEYENDHHTGMNIHDIAQWIIDYTSGYPFLVSKVCKNIDEKGAQWTYDGVVEAVKVVLHERNTLFDDMNKKLSDFSQMRTMLKNILYYGESYKFNIDVDYIEIASMFGFVKNDHGLVRVANRIFETRLYNAFASEEENNLQLVQESYIEKNSFISHGELNVAKIMERFIIHYHEIYGDKDEKFHEREGRKYFMFYVKPIINGVGNYYIEAETRDQLRTDMIIDYLGKQYIIEMKIWRGESYHTRGEQQLLEYLDYYHLNQGYLMSFCFNKNKQVGVKTITLGDKTIVEGVV